MSKTLSKAVEIQQMEEYWFEEMLWRIPDVGLINSEVILSLPKIQCTCFSMLCYSHYKVAAAKLNNEMLK